MALAHPATRGGRSSLADRLIVSGPPVVLLVLAAYVLARLLWAAASDAVVSPYHVRLWWVDYEQGFTRRGLPGTVLALVDGVPTYAHARAAIVAVAVIGLASTLALAALAARQATTRARSWAVLAVVLCAPFTLTLLVRELGRFDSLGIAALLALATLDRWRLPAWPATACGAAVVLVAVASEEFLIAYLAPVALLTALRSTDRRTAAVRAVVLVVPGAVLAAASLLVPTPQGTLQAALSRAAAAGVGPAEPAGNDAVTALGADRAQQLSAFADYTPQALLATGLVYGALFLAGSWLLWQLTGRRAPRWVGGTAAYALVVAVAMSTVGIDFRRWWALAFLAVLATLVAVHAHPRRPRRSSPGPLVTLAAAGSVVAGLAGQNWPVAGSIPLNAELLERVVSVRED